MKHTLYIDTASNMEVKVGLENNGELDIVTKKSDTWKAQAVLPLIKELLAKHELTLQDIEAIEVNEGPGSFTGLRVGIAIANTLGASLQVPINGKKVGELVEPRYQ